MGKEAGVMYCKSRNIFLFFSYNRFKDDKVFVPQSFKEAWVKMPVSFDAETSNEQIFEILNMDSNPLGTPKNQQWIRDNGARHTSMSVGDVIVRDGDYFVVMGVGFKQLFFIDRDGGEVGCWLQATFLY
jgi:hypothetical protein